MRNKKETGSTLLLLFTSLLWGFAFVPQVKVMAHMGSFTFGGARFAMGALSLLPVIFFLERRSGGRKQTRQTLLYGVAGGSVLFAASSLQQFGIQFTNSAGKSGFITGLYIILVPIFGIFLKHTPPWLTWLGALSACAGLYFLCAPNGFGSVGLGDVLLLVGAGCWAVHIHLVDHLANRVQPIRFSAMQFSVCAALSTAAAFLFEDPQLSGIRAGILPLLYGGFVSVGIAFTLQIVGQRHVEPARAAIIFSLESLFAALCGALFLREAMGWKGWLGGGLMLLGIVLAQVAPRVCGATGQKTLPAAEELA